MTLKYGYLFNVNIKILIFQTSWYRNQIGLWSLPKTNVVSTSNFDVDVVSTLKCGYVFNIIIKILIFQASWYKKKIFFRVNPKSMLFQRWILSMNQRWQIDVELTWISRWRYFNRYQRWINVECLLGCFIEVISI